MSEVSHQRFGDSVAAIVGIGISTSVCEGQNGDRINVGCFAGEQVPNEDCRQSDGNNATAYNNPKPTALEGSIRQSWYGDCSTGVGVALQPLQIGSNIRCVLVAQVLVFLQTLIEDAFQFRWKVGI